MASHESSPRPHRPHKDTGRGERNKPQPRYIVVFIWLFAGSYRATLTSARAPHARDCKLSNPFTRSNNPTNNSKMAMNTRSSSLSSRTAVGRALHALLLVVFLAFSAVAQQPDVIADATNGNAGSRLLLEASDADDASLDIDAFNVEGELDLVDELGPRRALLDKKKGGSSGSKSKGSYGGDTRLCDSSKTHS